LYDDNTSAPTSDRARFACGHIGDGEWTTNLTEIFANSGGQRLQTLISTTTLLQELIHLLMTTDMNALFYYARGHHTHTPYLCAHAQRHQLEIDLRRILQEINHLRLISVCTTMHKIVAMILYDNGFGSHTFDPIGANNFVRG